MNIENIIKAFVAGSCWPVFVPFFWGFNSLKPQYNKENMKKLLGNTDPYYLYTITAPVYFGTMSVISVIIAETFKINIRLSYFIISLISPIFVSSLIKLNNVYTFSKKRWLLQYVYLFLYHSFAYNVVAANIYQLIR